MNQAKKKKAYKEEQYRTDDLLRGMIYFRLIVDDDGRKKPLRPIVDEEALRAKLSRSEFVSLACIAYIRKIRAKRKALKQQKLGE